MEIRGNPNQPGDVVSPAGSPRSWHPASISASTPDAPEARRRERLAAGSASARNPLFARVIVNRLWQAHFGTGFVETASDFGFNGGKPSHPELLDWLAGEIVAQGWSLKAMHRLILISAAFRQSSRSDAAASSRDAGNRLIWQRPPVRLQAEMVRDAMLGVSGVLETRLGGPSFFDQRSYKAPGNGGDSVHEHRSRAPGTNRRTLFRAWLAAAAVTCSTPSIAPTRRPPHRGGRSRPRRSRPSR